MAVVTAYLMKTEGLGWEDAYAAVRAAKPDAEWVPVPRQPFPAPRPPGTPSPPSLLALPPRRVNPGFQGQLKLYEAMGCAVDCSSAFYKRYRLQMLTERYPGEWP